jgi:hypothetical protein
LIETDIRRAHLSQASKDNMALLEQRLEANADFHLEVTPEDFYQSLAMMRAGAQRICAQDRGKA